MSEVIKTHDSVFLLSDHETKTAPKPDSLQSSLSQRWWVQSPMNQFSLSPIDQAIIIALAENGLSVSKVARQLHYHRNNIDYHIRRIQEITSLNPKDFYDMIKLLRMCGKEVANGLHP